MRTFKKLTLEEKQLVIELYKKGNSIKDISISLNKHYNSIKSFIRKGKGICSGTNSQNSLENVINYLKDFSYRLLSIYHRACEKIEIECPNKHKYYVTFSKFKSGVRCRECYKENKRTKNVFDKLRNMGFQIFSEKFITIKHKIEVNCPNGHKCYVTWSAVQESIKHGGNGCRFCFYKRNHNQNHPNWNENL